MFWPLKSSSEFLGVPEDSKSPLLGVWVSSSHLAQSGVATLATLCNFGILTIFSLTWVVNATNRESSFCQSHLASTLSTCMEHFHSKPFICENWNNKLNRHYFIEQVLYVTTLTLGLQPRQKVWKSVGQKCNLGITFTFLGVQESVKEWTHVF